MSKPKVLLLNPKQVAIRVDGIHLHNPMHPYVVLPESYEVTPNVIRAIKYGTLIDVNKNVLVDKSEVQADKVNIQVNLKSEIPVEVEEVSINEEDAEEVSSEESEVSEDGTPVQQNKYNYKSKKKYK